MVWGLVEAPITAMLEGFMMWSRLCDMVCSSPKVRLAGKSAGGLFFSRAVGEIFFDRFD